MRLSFFLFIILSLGACDIDSNKGSQPTLLIMQYSNVNTHNLHLFPEVESETNIDILIKGMSAQNCVYRQVIGIAGEYTREFACYEKLCQIASGEQLLHLIRTNNDPVVKAYALLGLEKKEINVFKKGRKLLLNDERVICILSGCNKIEIPLNLFAEISKHTSEVQVSNTPIATK